ncbi:hypothetical protein TRFO_16689 [Tritrichomonas foetus]|uniref:CLASP N-terminal domain-containing protein n=1 Tax=Tritrichomonas foetus TaxID=1144522 RepID=A0A1J4KPS4_9EUKA|nr:hypothetical protein TRFO_16689 [Tritrichomonas foetus]|eukprot:OHT13243.1 hypothetical protein TRFO_16689 [Tritrichomonas foetus]
MTTKKKSDLDFGFIPKQVSLKIDSRSDKNRIASIQYINIHLPLSIPKDFNVNEFINLIRDRLCDNNPTVSKVASSIISKLIARIGPISASSYLKLFVGALAPQICNTNDEIRQLGRSAFRDLVVATADPQQSFDELVNQTKFMMPAQQCEICQCFSDLINERLLPTKFLLNYNTTFSSFLNSTNEKSKSKVQTFIELVRFKDSQIADQINKFSYGKTSNYNENNPTQNSVYHNTDLIGCNECSNCNDNSYHETNNNNFIGPIVSSRSEIPNHINLCDDINPICTSRSDIISTRPKNIETQFLKADLYEKIRNNNNQISPPKFISVPPTTTTKSSMSYTKPNTNQSYRQPSLPSTFENKKKLLIPNKPVLPRILNDDITNGIKENNYNNETHYNINYNEDRPISTDFHSIMNEKETKTNDYKKPISPLLGKLKSKPNTTSSIHSNVTSDATTNNYISPEDRPIKSNMYEQPLTDLKEETRASTQDAIRDRSNYEDNSDFHKYDKCEIYGNNDDNDYNYDYNYYHNDNTHSNYNSYNNDQGDKGIFSKGNKKKILPPFAKTYNKEMLKKEKDSKLKVKKHLSFKAPNKPLYRMVQVRKGASTKLTLEKIMNDLGSKEWDDQNNAITELTENKMQFEKEISQNLRNIIVSLLECASSLRTILAKNALTCMLELLNIESIDYNSISEMFSSSLLQIVMSSKKFIVDLASQCLLSLMKRIQPNRAASILIRECQRKHPACRVRVAEAIVAIIQKVPDPKILSESLSLLSNDPSPDVRKFAKEASSLVNL